MTRSMETWIVCKIRIISLIRANTICGRPPSWNIWTKESFCAGAFSMSWRVLRHITQPISGFCALSPATQVQEETWAQEQESIQTLRAHWESIQALRNASIRTRVQINTEKRKRKHKSPYKHWETQAQTQESIQTLPGETQAQTQESMQTRRNTSASTRVQTTVKHKHKHKSPYKHWETQAQVRARVHTNTEKRKRKHKSPYKYSETQAQEQESIQTLRKRETQARVHTDTEKRKRKHKKDQNVVFVFVLRFKELDSCSCVCAFSYTCVASENRFNMPLENIAPTSLVSIAFWEPQVSLAT